MLLPLRTKNPPETLPIVTYFLLGVNTLAFAFTAEYLLHIKDGALDAGGLSLQQPDAYRFVTHMFLHADLLHLAGNMLLLWILGRAVEGRLGWWKYALVYLLAGMAGSLLHLGLAGKFAPGVSLIGASGAIYGVLGAALVMFPFAPVTFLYGFYYRWGTVDWPVWGVALYYLAFDMLGVWLSWGSSGGGVANLAHIGGAAAGVVLCCACRPKRDSAFVSEAKATLAETHDFRTLSRMQLHDLHLTQPNDPEVLVHYVSSCIGDGRQVEPETWTRFLAALPAMIPTCEPARMNSIVLWSLSTPNPVPPRHVQAFAARCEQEGLPQYAFTLYDRVARDHNATPADWENSLFRMAALRERWFNDKTGAAHLYQVFLQHYPMSPLAPQVQERLRVIGSQAVH